MGPAVMHIRRPDSSETSKSDAASSMICRGSSMRPSPTSPQACGPESGPKISMPRARRAARLSCVAGLFHIAWFMAGATATGALVASTRVLSRSPACPDATRARKSALAGATTTRSGQRASSIWPMPASASASSNWVCTLLPERACKVRGVMNSVAAGVMTTRTSAPALLKSLASSALL